MSAESEFPFEIPEGGEVVSRSIMGGRQARVTFPNGYGGSVVQHAGSYGGPEGFWELAVFDGKGLTYDTPITSDVIGWLADADVTPLLAAICALPPAPSGDSVTDR